MIVSALLTSVAINLGLSIMFSALYSVLRKQPENAEVYAPRLVAEGRAKQRAGFKIKDFLPSPGWVAAAWRLSEDELMALSGLDGVVFMRIFTFSLKVFSVAAVVGIFILLPVNYGDNQLRNIDLSELPNKSLDLFSISNIRDGSDRLWIHFTAAYLISGVVCYLLYVEFRYIYFKRLELFNTSKPKPHYFTILVRGIPACNGRSLSDTVERFFMEIHPWTYLSHVVVHQTSRLRNLIADTKKVYQRLTHLKSTPDASQRYTHGFLGFGKNVDHVDDYAKKLGILEENLRIEQSGISMAGEEVPAAFVCFKSRYGAAAAFYIQQSINPTQWVTEPAPEVDDVYWPFFSTSVIRKWISKLVVILASIVLIAIFLIPVTFVQGLTDLNQLETLFPFLKSILKKALVSQIITGYLPSLILHLFLCMVPPIMKLFSSMQSYIAYSQIEKSACEKMLWFIIWNIFFANIFAGSITREIQAFLDPKNIPWVLATAVTAQASFFITYVVTSWTSVSSKLTRLIHLVGDRIKKRYGIWADDDFHAPSIRFHSEIPRLLLFGLLGLNYFLLAPLILPFILVFFCIGYIIYRNQLLNVYVPKYDTGGKFWLIVHNSTIFSLVLMQAIAVGIFGLKHLPLASVLISPLPVLTLMFNEYCRKRFLPIFSAYPAEILIKKDRQEHNDPEMREFFKKLVTAYRDPALLPIQDSLNASERYSPLLSSY